MAEPLLSRDRLQLMPIVYHDLWEFYKRAESAFWTVEEVDLARDRRDFESLTRDEQHFISHVLAFFATADALVFDNIDSNFGEEVQIREAKAFYGFQRMMEGIHNEMYSVMIETLISDADKKKEIFEAVEQFPGLRAKLDWAHQFADRKCAPFGERLVAFVIMEYIFFSASFAAIFYFKKRNKMNGLCTSNEFISRDEAMHAEFGVKLYNDYLLHKPPVSRIAQMVREAVDIETRFVHESLPVRLIGMNADEMTQYVQYVADHMLNAMRLPKLYNAINPFPWMELISLNGKTNFFEKRVSEYSKAGVGAESSAATFSLQEDF